MVAIDVGYAILYTALSPLRAGDITTLYQFHTSVGQKDVNLAYNSNYLV